MTVKKVIGKLHLWLGLGSGLVVFIVALTGAIYAFQEEISSWLEPNYTLSNSKGEFMIPDKYREIGQKINPGHEVHSVNYKNRQNPVEIVYYDMEPFHYSIAKVDPSTGDLLHHKNFKTDFFYQVLQGHYYLWLPPSVGKPLVSISTLVFAFMLFSGIILWWPKNKNARKQRFSFKWKKTTSFKRRNYDLHNILGFYSSFLGLILCVTGLVFGFEWFAKGYHKALGGKTNLSFEMPKVHTDSTQTIANSDTLFQHYISQNNFHELEWHFPEKQHPVIYLSIRQQEHVYYHTDHLFFNAFTLEEVKTNNIYQRYQEATFADKMMRMNYDIHVGQIAGITGKTIAFFISLIIASLPITGCIIWLKRKKKNRKGKSLKTFKPIDNPQLLVKNG